MSIDLITYVIEETWSFLEEIHREAAFCLVQLFIEVAELGALEVLRDFRLDSVLVRSELLLHFLF